MITLKTNKELWQDFQGAMTSRRGEDPEFAEIRLINPPIATITDDDRDGILILDAQDDEHCLTLNLMTQDGFPAAYSKRIDEFDATRLQLKTWAEATLAPEMTHANLILSGFTFEEL